MDEYEFDDTDPIEELHEIRRRLLAEAGGTIEGYMRQLREQEKLHPENLVDLSKSRRKPETTAKPAAPRAKAKAKTKTRTGAPAGKRKVAAQ